MRSCLTLSRHDRHRLTEIESETDKDKDRRWKPSMSSRPRLSQARMQARVRRASGRQRVMGLTLWFLCPRCLRRFVDSSPPLRISVVCKGALGGLGVNCAPCSPGLSWAPRAYRDGRPRGQLRPALPRGVGTGALVIKAFLKMIGPQ